MKSIYHAVLFLELIEAEGTFIVSNNTLCLNHAEYREKALIKQLF